jgi:hypothetical protein
LKPLFRIGSSNIGQALSNWFVQVKPKSLVVVSWILDYGKVPQINLGADRILDFRFWILDW